MRWVQTPEDLRRQPATTAAHARMRERFLALYEITQAGCATQVAKCDERNPQTLMKWVHWYNAQGSEALVHRKSGGRLPVVQALDWSLKVRQRAAELDIELIPLPAYSPDSASTPSPTRSPIASGSRTTSIRKRKTTYPKVGAV